MTDNETELLKKIADDVAWIKTLLRGNGSPEKGWIVRFDRMEQLCAAGKWVLGATAGAVIVLIITRVMT